MADKVEFPRDWMIKWDAFRPYCDNFERDVHILILGTLGAAITYLNKEAQEYHDELAPDLKTAEGEGLAYLEEKLGEIWGYVGDQERFLRNMALVALLARVTYTLNSMARSAESFGPGDPNGYEGNNEFQMLWNEYGVRFEIKFSPKYIQWIEPLRKARNLIIHHGSEANPLKPPDKTPADADVYDHRDLSFSTKYPRMVEGEDYSAEVVITDQQLVSATKKAIELIRYTSSQLRARHLAIAKKKKQATS